jgi:hypothetical protein
VNERQVRAAVRAWHDDLVGDNHLADGSAIDLWPGIATELHAIDTELASERMQISADQFNYGQRDSDRRHSDRQRQRSSSGRLWLERILDALLPRFALGGLVTAFVGVLALFSVFSGDGSTPVFEQKPFEKQGPFEKRVAMHRATAEGEGSQLSAEPQEFVQLQGEVEGRTVSYEEPLILRVKFDPNYLARGDEDDGEHLSEGGADDPIAYSQLRLPLPTGRAFVRRALRSEQASRGNLWQVADLTRPAAFQNRNAHTPPRQDELR